MKTTTTLRVLLLTVAALGLFSSLGCSNHDSDTNTPSTPATKSANVDASKEGGTKSTVPPRPKLDSGQ